MEPPQQAPQRQAPEEPAASAAAAAARPRGSSRVSNAFAALPMGGSSSEVLTSLPPELPAARPQGSVAAGGAPAAARGGRKSLCLPPGRIPGGSADLTALLGDGAGSGSSQAGEDDDACGNDVREAEAVDQRKVVQEAEGGPQLEEAEAGGEPGGKGAVEEEQQRGTEAAHGEQSAAGVQDASGEGCA